MAYIPYLVTFILCTAVIFLSATNLTLALRGDFRGKKLGVMAGVAATLQLLITIVFSYSQSVWILHHHADLVGEKASLLWLSFDYLNFLFHLFIASSLRAFLSCRY